MVCPLVKTNGAVFEEMLRAFNPPPPPPLPILQNYHSFVQTKLKDLNAVALVGERTMPAERPPFVGKVVPTYLRIEGVAWSAQRIPTVINLGFLDRSRYFFFQVAPQLSSRGWVDPVPDPLLLRKSGNAGNQTQDLGICSQKLWPLDHRGGRYFLS
jgi:hypothetical protein